MVSKNGSGRVTDMRRMELELKFHELEADVARQHRIIRDLERDGHPSVGAHKALLLMQKEQTAVIEELGYNPRSN